MAGVEPEEQRAWNSWQSLDELASFESRSVVLPKHVCTVDVYATGLQTLK
jgi:hypothetical protein